MNHHRTPSILQRVPVILAVTAASYGLPMEARGCTASVDTADRAGAATLRAHERVRRGGVAQQH